MTVPALRSLAWGSAIAVAVPLVLQGSPRANAAEIEFDLPASIECHDVTPPDFAAAETLKVIEGKLRISARVVDGSESDIVDFMYVISNPQQRMRIQDYLPNTTLESAVADDQIEVKDATEKASSASADVHVVYKILSLGGTLSQTTKDSEANCYRQIAPKELVVASGTTDREHGVFFRLRPSRTASLEGAKEFSFLATVPKAWRGDICTISCRARVRQHSFWSDSIVSSGERTVEVGLYLAGDSEAASLAEQLRQASEDYQRLQAERSQKTKVLNNFTVHSVSLFPKKAPAMDPLEESRQTLVDIQQRIKHLGR
jgi:hypothetical protein